jgi:DNA polymerase III delta prime subunit
MTEFLWVEKYRPQTIEDTILPDKLKATFQQFVDQKSVPNLLLTGRAGVGKTTVARAMLEQLGCDYMIINGSLYGNIDTLRTTIHTFASSVSLMGGRKYVILDEADYLNANSTQPALRNFMEEFSKNCGFILTCNYVNKIIEPLQSRCSIIDFKIEKADSAKLAAQFFKRAMDILQKENVEADKAAVAEVIKKYFPDWRRVLNELQRYGATGKIDSGILSNFQETSLKALVDSMKKKDLTAVRKWIAEHSDMDSATFYRTFYDVASNYFTPAGIAQLIVILAKYQYQEAFVADREINTAAMCIEISLECDFK